MEYRRIMFHLCIYAHSLGAITHETNTVLGLLLCLDDWIHNMAAQSSWAETCLLPIFPQPMCSGGSPESILPVHIPNSLHFSLSIPYLSLA